MNPDFTARQQEALAKMALAAVQDHDLPQLKLCVEKGADLGRKEGVTYNFREPHSHGGTIHKSESVCGPLFFYYCLYQFQSHKKDMADFFLQHVTVDARDDGGNTALLWAVRTEKSELVKYLVDKGADPLALNKKGESALDVANGLAESSHSPKKEIIRALLKAMPDRNAAASSAFNEAALKKDTPAGKPFEIRPRPKKDDFEM